jgi:hypothetical protein
MDRRRFIQSVAIATAGMNSLEPFAGQQNAWPKTTASGVSTSELIAARNIDTEDHTQLCTFKPITCSNTAILIRNKCAPQRRLWVLPGTIALAAAHPGIHSSEQENVPTPCPSHPAETRGLIILSNRFRISMRIAQPNAFRVLWAPTRPLRNLFLDPVHRRSTFRFSTIREQSSLRKAIRQ